MDKSIPIVTVPASYARALFATVAEQGHDADAMLAAESLTHEELSGRTVPAAAFGRLYQRAIWILQDESLGLVSGGRVVSGTFRMMCLSVIGCADLAAIVARVGEFLDVARGVVVKPHLLRDDDLAHIGFALTRGVTSMTLDEVLGSQDDVRIRTTLYLWHKLLGWFADRTLPLEAVRFAFEAPPNGDAWERLFGCPVEFGAGSSALVTSADTLDWPNVQSERSLEAFLKSAPYRLIVSAHGEQSLSDRVLALFGDDFSRPMPSAVETGRRLGLSVSTLRRRLVEEGASFQRLKDESRRTAAIRYLADTDLSLADIARLLGFDEPSAFFRAFRRWTGMTPSRYRSSEGVAARLNEYVIRSGDSGH